jgi:hypothetical protein
MRKAAPVFLCLVAFSSVLLAQKQTPAQVNNPSIEIESVKLQLGMTKADVLERYVGTEITKMSEDRWILGKWGTVDFRSGKLVFVDRSWNSIGDDHIGAIFALVSSLSREGYTSCRVFAESNSVPVTDSASGIFQHVWIDCGIKAIHIVKSKIGDHIKEGVSEQLGVRELKESKGEQNGSTR